MSDESNSLRDTMRDDDPPKNAEELPDPSRLPELIIYSHSTLFYWWPVWLTGFIMAAITFFRGGTIELDNVRNEYFHPSSGLGVTFVLILLLVIIFTNVKLRGIYSLAMGLGVAFLAVLFAWLGWWDNIFAFIPRLSVHMNLGFYLVFSTLLFVIWALSFFVFDRLTFWRIRPGQLTEERWIGGGEESYDVRGMLFEQHGDDFFRHKILGLGSGDLQLNLTGAKSATIEIPNVMFAEKKVKTIQTLVAIKPDDFK